MVVVTSWQVSSRQIDEGRKMKQNGLSYEEVGERNFVSFLLDDVIKSSFLTS